MINISLTKFNWFEYKNEHFQVWNVGYVFFENVFYSNKELSEFFVSNFEKVDFKELLNKLSGNFAIIIKTNSKLLIISDIVRSYPLIYTVKNQTVQVYDCDIAYKKENEDFEIDLQNLKQYVCSGLVFGNKTIYKQVFGIQAAESVLINLNTFKISTERYYLFLYKKNDNKEYKIDINEIAEKFDKILINIFERIIQSAPNVNNWIIPLSGGHDSRLIAYYFHKLGIKNIICYSYGRVGSVQGKISKKIAENLGYKWEFIEIDNALVKRIIEGNFIEKQIDYSFIGSSTVEIQNFLPMFGLLDKNLISKNDIFVPGHALDFIAGSKIDNSLMLIDRKEDVIDVLTSRNNFWNFPSNILSNSIDEAMSSFNSFGVETIESFGWQERQSKYIVNAVRAYDFFDFDWRLPFWDKEIVDFFSNIPAKYQIKRHLFYEIEKLVYDEEIKSIPFDENYKYNITERLKQLTNYFLRNFANIFGLTIPYLLDEGYNRLFSKDERKVKIFNKYFLKIGMKNEFKVYKNTKLSRLHVNQVIRLKIVEKLLKNLI